MSWTIPVTPPRRSTGIICFITLLGVQLVPASGRLSWVRAGHEPGILYHARENRFEILKGDGVALGLDPETVFPENETADIVPGDILVLYTDGIPEARNPQGTMFGRERMLDCIRDHAHQSAKRIRDALLDKVSVYIDATGVEDDMTLVVVKFT